jgi:hypothetical protein
MQCQATRQSRKLPKKKEVHRNNMSFLQTQTGFKHQFSHEDGHYTREEGTPRQQCRPEQ